MGNGDPSEGTGKENNMFWKDSSLPVESCSRAGRNRRWRDLIGDRCDRTNEEMASTHTAAQAGVPRKCALGDVSEKRNAGD